MTKRAKRNRRMMVEPLEGRALLSAGALDTTFGGTGMVSTNLDSTGDAGYAVAAQPDSKVVVVGHTGANTYPPHLAVVRYNPDGSLDTTFGSGGIFIDPFGPNVIEQGPCHQGVAIQADGKIVVAGNDTVEITTTTKSGKKTTTTTTDYSDWVVFRLNTNGTLDTTFGNGGQVITPFSSRGSNTAESVTIQPADGKIVVAGGASLQTAGPYAEFTLARYNTNGTPDTTFGSGGVVMTDVSKLLGVTNVVSMAESVAIDSSGRIVVAGNAEAFNQIARSEMAVVRYTPSGSLDTTFGTGGAVGLLPLGATGSTGLAVGLQPGGQIVVGGRSQPRNGVNGVGKDAYELTIARLTPNGALDPTFGAGGSGFYSSSQLAYPESMVLQGDGKILMVGYGPYTSPGVFDPDFWVTRVLADGSAADPSFGTDGVAEAVFGVSTVPVGVAIDPAGNIVLTGQDTNSALPQFRTARFLGDPPPLSAAARVGGASTSVPAPPAVTASTPLLDLTALALDSPDLLTWLRPKNSRKV